MEYEQLQRELTSAREQIASLVTERECDKRLIYTLRLDCEDIRRERDSAITERDAERGQTKTGLMFNEEIRSFTLQLIDSFKLAARSYPAINIDPEIMAGAPCITGTRIPVYMLLDAIECNGTLESAIESFPRLNMQHIKDAIGFAKLVVECPIERDAQASGVERQKTPLLFRSLSGHERQRGITPKRR